MVGFQKLSFLQPSLPIFFPVSVQFSSILPFSWKGTTFSNNVIVVHTPCGLFSEQYDSVKSVFCLCIFRSFWSTQFPISGSNRYTSGIFDQAQTSFGALEMFGLFENYWKVFLCVAWWSVLRNSGFIWISLPALRRFFVWKNAEAQKRHSRQWQQMCQRWRADSMNQMLFNCSNNCWHSICSGDWTINSHICGQYFSPANFFRFDFSSCSALH